MPANKKTNKNDNQNGEDGNKKKGTNDTAKGSTKNLNVDANNEMEVENNLNNNGRGVAAAATEAENNNAAPNEAPTPSTATGKLKDDKKYESEDVAMMESFKVIESAKSNDEFPDPEVSFCYSITFLYCCFVVICEDHFPLPLFLWIYFFGFDSQAVF